MDTTDKDYNEYFNYGKDKTKEEQQEPEQKLDISFDEWNTILIEKYEILYKTVNELIPELWTPLEFALSIKTILNIKNCTLPFAGISYTEATMKEYSACRDKIIGYEQLGVYTSPEAFRLALSFCGSQ
jgi:hypothetical protein